MTGALLDTNILIAMASNDETTPDLSRFDAVSISALSWTELLRGTHSATDLVRYKARSFRDEWIHDRFGRGIAFDDACVHAFERVVRDLAAQGRDVRSHHLDRMIAATALAHDLAVVTRDRTGFAGLEGLLEVIEV